MRRLLLTLSLCLLAGAFSPRSSAFTEVWGACGRSAIDVTPAAPGLVWVRMLAETGPPACSGLGILGVEWTIVSCSGAAGWCMSQALFQPHNGTPLYAHATIQDCPSGETLSFTFLGAAVLTDPAIVGIILAPTETITCP